VLLYHWSLITRTPNLFSGVRKQREQKQHYIGILKNKREKEKDLAPTGILPVI
jgi:hypothetical protein